VWPVPLAQVLPHPQLIFPSKTWFFGIYLNFQRQKKNQYLSHSESKSYQINSIKSSHQDLSNNTKGTFQFLQNFQLQFKLIFSEEIIQYSRTFAPRPNIMEPSPCTPPRLELSKDIKNKLPSFIDRLAGL
jgi:hypothetical protein